MPNMTMHYTPQQLGNINRRLSHQVGWRAKYPEIKTLLGLSSTMPLAEDFAAAVATWQASHPPLRTDGLLGKETWARMRSTTRISADGRPPLPAWLLTGSSHRIRYDVPLRRQFESPICWVACAVMMLAYRDRRPMKLKELTDDLDQHTTSIPNLATTWDQFRQFLVGEGFVFGPAESGYPDEDYLARMLLAKGPLMLYHSTMSLWNAKDASMAHAAVITGIDTDKDECFLNNPWGTKDQRLPTQKVLDAIGYVWTQDIPALIWLR
jgi:hypothetical protein